MNKNIHGVLRINPANPRYFTDHSGKSVYLAGSHTWAVLQDVWKACGPRREMAYDAFVQMMEDYGHNYLRFWPFSLYPRNCRDDALATRYDPMPYERTGPGLANDGLPKFDLTRFNLEYFSRLRKRIEKAAEHGIYAGVILFESCGLKWASPECQPWEYHVYNPENNVNGIADDPRASVGLYAGNYVGIFSLACKSILEVQKAFVRKVIDTLNDMDSVLFEVCNEIPNTPEAMLWQEHVCSFIHEYEKRLPKQHMVGITAEGGTQANEQLYLTTADWISPSNGKGYEYRYNPPAADGRKVILNDTDHLWGHGGEVPWVWKSFTRGMNVLFMDPWEPHPGSADWWQDGDVTINQRYYYAWDDVRRNLGYTRRLSLSFDMNAMIPDGDFCTSGYSLCNRNQQYICYFPAGGTEGLDLTSLDGVFHVEWFRPATGQTVKAEDLPTAPGSIHETFQRAAVHAPFEGPSVLLLYKRKESDV